MVVADSLGEARDLGLPRAQAMARLRTGRPMGFLDLVEDAQQRELPPDQQAIAARWHERAVIGTPPDAAAEIVRLAEHFGVDEVMVNPQASARRGADPRRAAAREYTIDALARELL